MANAGSTHNHNTRAPPRSLLDLPPELRNQIYEVLAVQEPRLISVQDLMTSTMRPKDLNTLQKALEPAVALHPLSRTCRTCRREFQHLYVDLAKSSYVFLIDNFDLEQIEFVAKLLENRFARTCQQIELEGVNRYFSPYDITYSPPVRVDFTLDSDCAKSAQKLLDFIVEEDQLPVGLTTCSLVGRNPALRINTFSPFSQLHINHYVPGMSLRDASASVKARQLATTRGVFAKIENLLLSPDSSTTRSATWSDETVYWIRHVWGRPLSRYYWQWQQRAIEPRGSKPFLLEGYPLTSGFPLHVRSDLRS